jgi:hypothetical protein
MIVSTSELAKEVISRKLLIFKRYKVDVKEIKHIFQWWEKYESMFLIVSFLACQILGIVGSQIEIEIIYFLIGILTNLKRCLQLQNLEKLIFVNKN